MGIAPLSFAGQSKYASDYQNILTRAVNIASLPLRTLQNRDSDLLQQKAQLGSLSGAVSNFANSLAALSKVAAKQALGATSSDTSVVNVSNTGATSPVSYNINSITSIASPASERSQIGYADSGATPVSTTGSVKLVVGNQNYNFTLTNNTLVGLRDKINSLGTGVSASILTTGNDNYLSLSSSLSGATTLELRDDPSGANTNLLTATNQGTDAVFKLNGIDVSQKGNVVNSVIPGVTFSLLKASASPVTLTLATDRSQLSSALSSFVGDYNSLRAQLDSQSGTSAGFLAGQPTVTQLNRLLRQVASYKDTTGAVRSIEDLGISFSNTGKASLDSAKFNALSNSQVAAGFSFIGTASTGLGKFAKSFTQFSDPLSGVIRLEQDGIDRTDKQLQSRISLLTERINAMQTALSQRLAHADTLSARLESQQSNLTASLQGLSVVLYGKQNG